MATKKSVRRFFNTKKKMDNTLDHESLPEQPTESVEQAETVVVEPEAEVVAQEPEATVKSVSPCQECNGTGLKDSDNLCSNCGGSGQL